MTCGGTFGMTGWNVWNDVWWNVWNDGVGRYRMTGRLFRMSSVDRTG